MPKRPDFTPTDTPKGWCISIPPAMAASGKRERRFFSDRKLADREASRLRGIYMKGGRGELVPATIAIQATEAAKLLEPYGITILDAARLVAERYRTAGTLETLAERYARVVADRENHWRDRYARDMGKIERWVGPELMAERVADLTPASIKAALMAHGAKSPETIRARYARVASIVAGKDLRGKRAAKIAIMDTTAAAKLLRACEDDSERRAVAVILFAGIRPDAEDGEISRLQWSDVTAAEIYVPTHVSKTGTDRHVPLNPRLRRLIRGHPASGPVAPSGWRRKWQRLRKTAGIADEQDITRHTFASHFLAAFGVDAAKQAMGHTAGSDTLFRHYRRAVTAEAGRRFFGSLDRAIKSLPDLRQG